MRDPEPFDAFYQESRTRLLLQTYALTGDLTASRAAVRDAFVATWHHWRKVERLTDPEAWTRPRAWAHAQRRHTARLWHRDRKLDPEVKATLDALGRLPVTQRKVLLLNQLASTSLDDLAREVGLPREDAERELQAATARLALLREVPTTSLRPLLDALGAVVADTRWPRSSIVRRAGARRRRTHTVVGLAAAIAAIGVTGAVVGDTTGVVPTLSREITGAASTPGRSPAPAAVEVEELSDGHLLDAAEVTTALRGRPWVEAGTDDNTTGDGLVMPCQQARYADPQGSAALVRRFTPSTSPATRQRQGGQGDQSSQGNQARPDRRSAVQATEASRTDRAARRTYRTALGWFAGCTDDRVQLLSTRRVDAVGDEAMLLVVRGWNTPVTTSLVGVARTGTLTTTTLTSTTSTDTPDVGAAVRLLAGAVDGLCTLPEAGACASRPTTEVVPPVRAGSAPAMLGEFDLPPVSSVGRPWVGTQARRAVDNVASTRCDEADFSGRGDAAPMTRNQTRSYVIPGARLPAEFGLTETVGALPVRRARAFVADVRDKLASCEDRDLGTQVRQIRQSGGPRQELAVWSVTTEISDERSVRFLMAILRTGTSVAQVGFVPTTDVTMSDRTFVSLAERALERLGELRPPARG